MDLSSQIIRKPSKAMVNGFDPSRLDELPDQMQKSIRRRDKSLGPSYRLFYDEPLEIVRGKGVTLFDRDGNEYLDVYNNVPSVGHGHPRVIEAGSRRGRRRRRRSGPPCPG